MISNKGFTLIEIMVVIVIIGVVVSFITLAINNGGSTPQLQQEEAQRLASLLTLANQEAILQAKELGVAFTSEGYRFYEWRGLQWQALNNHDLFHPRTLPSTIQLVFYLANEPLQLAATGEKPQLLLLSSGEFTPFEIRLIAKSNQRKYYRLTGDVTGTVSIQSVEF
jgi:general secretion pathway protein H